MKGIVFDTETTGRLLPDKTPVERQPRIIEIGCALVQDGLVVDTYSKFVDPQQPITSEITKITGINSEMIAGAPTFAELWPEFSGVLRWADVVIAHNAYFDKSMVDNMRVFYGVGAEFIWPEVRCSIQEFQHLFGRQMKLVELYERVVGKPLAQTHRALDDVVALVEVLQAFGYWEMVDDSASGQN